MRAAGSGRACSLFLWKLLCIWQVRPNERDKYVAALDQVRDWLPGCSSIFDFNPCGFLIKLANVLNLIVSSNVNHLANAGSSA